MALLPNKHSDIFTANVYGVTSDHVIAYALLTGGKVPPIYVTSQNETDFTGSKSSECMELCLHPILL
jgi:hypothetical protein